MRNPNRNAGPGCFGVCKCRRTRKFSVVSKQQPKKAVAANGAAMRRVARATAKSRAALAACTANVWDKWAAEGVPFVRGW